MSDLFLERDAVISDCGHYRYLLRRVWDHAKPRALICGLNPSTADANKEDASSRSFVRLTRELGFGSYETVNMYGWRATDPKALRGVADAIGADNDRIIEGAVSRCDLVICAWGVHGDPSRARRLYEIVLAARPAAYCFGRTKSGAPKHPLYIKSGTPLEVYLP